MMKDNFSNQNPFLSQVKQYQDLVNQPTATDAVAEANIRSMIPNPRNEGEILANSLSSGFAGGLKAHENQKRQERLSPILEQAGQITAKAAEIEAQMQNEQQTRMDATKLFQQAAAPLSQLSSASMAGDIPASNALAKGIYTSFKQGLGDPSMGDFDHYHNGTIYYHNSQTDIIEGKNIIGLMYQVGINPVEIWGQDAPMIEAGLSPGAKKNYEDSEKMKAAELAQKNSSTNMNNAHAGLFNAQTNSEIAKTSAPTPKYDDKTQSHIRTENTNWNNELYKKHKDAKVAIDAQVAMRNAIQQEVKNGSWGTGSSTFASVARWTKAKTNQNKAQQLIELKRQPLFRDLKNTFGSRVTDNDLATWLTTQVDLSNDPQLGIQVLNERIQESQKDINEELTRRRILETEFNNNEPYNSLLVDERVQKELKNNIINQNPETTSDNNMLQVVSPSGQIGMIPQASLQSAMQKGFKVQE